MMRLLPVIAFLIFSIYGRAETIRYDVIHESIVRQRIENVPKKNRFRYETIRALFEESGCGRENLIDQKAKGAKYPNVICSLPGTSEATILVSAHYDSVENGMGLIDNWSGASLLPTLFASVRKVPRRHRFQFVAFTGEEDGLLGSKYFVKHLDPDDRGRIHAVVNMDSLGLGPTKVEIQRGDKTLLNVLAIVAQNFLIPLNAVNVQKVGMSDSDSFQNANIPAICIHSLTTETYPVLHSSRDNVRALKFSDYYDSYRLVAAYLAYLDEVLDKN
jgi:putative aminopeptidase FrvX